MNWFYFIFIWLLIIRLLSERMDVYQQVGTDDELVYRWKWFWAIVAVWPVIYVTAFMPPRSDTVLYMKLFRRLPTTFADLKTVLLSGESGFGWTFFETIIKVLVRGNETGFRVVLCLMHLIPVIYVFRKYSSNYLVSFFLFLATGCHFAWLMNGLRQFLAVGIIFAATPLILQKKYGRLILIILLASTIHVSAIIMLPIIFIVQGHAWNKKTMLCILGAIILIVFFERPIEILDNMLKDTEYSGVLTNAIEGGDNGTNPIRVLVHSVPLIIAFFGRKALGEEDNPIINLCINMSIITTGIYLVSMVTSGIIIGRLPIYTGLYSYILLPYEIDKVFRDDAKIVNLAMVAMYLLYYMYVYR